MSRNKFTVMALLGLAIAYLVVTIYFEVPDQEADIALGVLLSAAIAFAAYQEYRDEKSSSHLHLALLCFFMFHALAMAALVLIGGSEFRFGALVLLNAVLGGVLFWFIDKHLPSATH
jgi:hypothetical protein